MVGECIGNYRIVQRLGEGGMATVYLATHPELGRRVAVKVLNPDLARSDQMVQRFFNEARAASGIGHRGIVEVFDLGTLPSGAPYIVMEHLDGESLAERMTKAGRLPLETAAEIAGQAASVMGAAHARGIVHRDLKPDNLFLVPDPMLPGRELVKVLDFGIAKLAQRPADGGGQRTRTGVILGTPRYMSPEQCRESRDVDHRTDVYSLGVVLYEMLAGAPPFVSGSWGELAHMHIGVIPPALQTHMPDVPTNVAQIVHRALEKDPGARFQSMAELENALRAAVAARAAVSPASALAAAAPTARGRAPAVGSTMRLEEPPSSARPRPQRRTTLAGAASEVQRDPDKPSRTVRIAPALVVAAAAAVVAIVGSLALRRTPPPVTTTAAPAVAEPAVAAPPAAVVPPAPIVEPAPPPPVDDRRLPPVQPADGALASQPAAKPASATPARRRRRSLAPAKSVAPAPVRSSNAGAAEDMRTSSIVGARIVVALVSAAVLASPARAAADAQPPAAGSSAPATPAAASSAPATPDEQARDLFRSQRYGEALAIYQRLRAETRHPTYLRNIGRCHQMMRQPAPAIDAFETYLREARDVDAGERAEIDGYIADMRRLELSAPPPASGAPPAAVSTPSANTPATVAVSTTAEPSPGGESSSIVRKWWFWAGVAALVAATGIIVVASSGEDRLPCPGGAVCP